MDKYAKKLAHKKAVAAGRKAAETRRAKRGVKEPEFTFTTVTLVNGKQTRVRSQQGTYAGMCALLKSKRKKLRLAGFEDLRKIYYKVLYRPRMSANEKHEISLMRDTVCTMRAGTTTVRMTVTRI